MLLDMSDVQHCISHNLDSDKTMHSAVIIVYHAHIILSSYPFLFSECLDEISPRTQSQKYNITMT